MRDVDQLRSVPSGPERLLRLAALYAGAPAAPQAPGPRVRAMMVSTLDGRATSDDGRTGGLGSPADSEVFEVVRALSDVVVVGAGTVRSEGYTRLSTPQPLVELRSAAGRSAHPVLAVVTASGRVPERALAERDDAGALLVLCAATTDAGPLRERLGQDQVVTVGHDAVDPAAAVGALRERGLADMVCEGGPHLLRDWVAHGVVDELCLTIRPLLLGGDGPRILAGGVLPGAARSWRTAQVLQMDGDLMLRALPPG